MHTVEMGRITSRTVTAHSPPPTIELSLQYSYTIPLYNRLNIDGQSYVTDRYGSLSFPNDRVVFAVFVYHSIV